MTNRESKEIASLREELHAYHIDVQKLVQQFEACRAEVVQIMADLYGLPGNKESNPGLLGEVAELRHSRRLMLLALRGAWVILTVLLGAVVTAVLQKN